MFWSPGGDIHKYFHDNWKQPVFGEQGYCIKNAFPERKKYMFYKTRIAVYIWQWFPCFIETVLKIKSIFWKFKISKKKKKLKPKVSPEGNSGRESQDEAFCDWIHRLPDSLDAHLRTYFNDPRFLHLPIHRKKH